MPRRDKKTFTFYNWTNRGAILFLGDVNQSSVILFSMKQTLGEIKALESTESGINCYLQNFFT